jgi:xylulokinase
MGGYTLGLDIGSSSVKATVLKVETGKAVGSFTSPVDSELAIVSPNKGWAQQDPDSWWEHSKLATQGALAKAKVKGDDIKAIGISYQMHGMTPIDANGNPLMDAIIWCDGRTIEEKLSAEKNPEFSTKFLEQNLNLPGHFTASKLAWFKKNRSDLYEKLDSIVLPGHYVLAKATGQKTTTASGLSEGIFWNFKDMCLSDLVMDHFGLEKKHIPEIKPTFGEHGTLKKDAAEYFGLKEETPFTYFAGDQPANAFSLNVLEPGEMAAIAGTSAVIYGITDKPVADKKTRVNQFLHVNSSIADHSNLRIGMLACINGAGISNRYVKDKLGGGNYAEMDKLAASVENTDSLLYVPFGNGPERTQQDKNTGAHLINLDLNRHTPAHIYRAVQEGVAFAMKYGAEIMNGLGMPTTRVRAGDGNMFKSRLFAQTFSDLLQAPLELYKTDGSEGAARGAAVGLGIYTLDNAFDGLEKKATIEPGKKMDQQYEDWCLAVQKMSK